MSEGAAEIGQDFLTRVLGGARERRVEFGMLEETYQEALRLAAEHGWEEGEALLSVFACGVAYLKGWRVLTGAGDAGAGHDAALEELARQYMQLESMYAVLKFRAYGMARDRQVLELNVAGLRPDNEGMRQRLFQYREEVKALKAEVRQLREDNRVLGEKLRQSQACAEVAGQGEPEARRPSAKAGVAAALTKLVGRKVR